MFPSVGIKNDMQLRLRLAAVSHILELNKTIEEAYNKIYLTLKQFIFDKYIYIYLPEFSYLNNRICNSRIVFLLSFTDRHCVSLAEVYEELFFEHFHRYRSERP